MSSRPVTMSRRLPASAVPRAHFLCRLVCSAGGCAPGTQRLRRSGLSFLSPPRQQFLKHSNPRKGLLHGHENALVCVPCWNFPRWVRVWFPVLCALLGFCKEEGILRTEEQHERRLAGRAWGPAREPGRRCWAAAEARLLRWVGRRHRGAVSRYGTVSPALLGDSAADAQADGLNSPAGGGTQL